MNFALLGDDAAALPLLRAIAGHPHHQLTDAAASGELTSEIVGLAPAVRVTPHGEELLGAPVDAVVVASDDPAALEAAKQLALAGVALLVIPRAEQGAAWVYELTLVRDDTQAMLFPLLPQHCHPLLESIDALLSEETFGKLLHIQMVRKTKMEDGGTSQRFIEQGTIDDALLTDVDLLRRIGGNYNRVTALHSGKTAQGVVSATVSLAGKNLPEATWSLEPAAQSEWQLTATGERGRAVLSGGSNLADWKLRIGEEQPEHHDDAADGGLLVLERFESALADTSVRPTWTDLTRAFEIVDAAHRSIKRRRTIDLYFETTSERSLFKSQMTAVGCGLLSLTLFAVLLLLLCAALLDPRLDVEIQAERAGSIITREEFSAETATLTNDGKEHLANVARQLQNETFPVLIEATKHADAKTLDEERRETVVRLLNSQGIAQAEQRTVVDMVRGKLFRPLMLVARVFVFLPLFAFLVLQFLLLIARPSSVDSKSNEQEEAA